MQCTVWCYSWIEKKYNSTISFDVSRRSSDIKKTRVGLTPRVRRRRHSFDGSEECASRCCDTRSNLYIAFIGTNVTFFAVQMYGNNNRNSITINHHKHFRTTMIYFKNIIHSIGASIRSSISAWILVQQ